MSDRTINFGESETEATYQIQDTDSTGGGNFVLAKDTNANTVLLQYDPATDTWEYAGDVDMNGGNVSGVGTLTAESVNTEDVDAESVNTEQLNNVVYHDETDGRIDIAEDGSFVFDVTGFSRRDTVYSISFSAETAGGGPERELRLQPEDSDNNPSDDSIDSILVGLSGITTDLGNNYLVLMNDIGESRAISGRIDIYGGFLRLSASGSGYSPKGNALISGGIDSATTNNSITQFRFDLAGGLALDRFESEIEIKEVSR